MSADRPAVSPEPLTQSSPTTPARTDASEAPDAPVSLQPPSGLWRHRLRGRVRWAAFAGCVLAIAGGVAGWLIERPVYRADALLAIQAPPTTGADEVAVLTRRAVEHAASRSVAELAITEPQLSATTGDEDEPAWTLARLMTAREVGVIDAPTGRLVISVADQDPAGAQAAAAALGKSAAGTWQLAVLGDLERLTVDQQKRKDAAADLAAAEAKLANLLDAAGPVPLDDRYRAKRSELETVSSELTRAGIAAADAADAPAPVKPNDPEAEAARLALTDGRLATLLVNRTEAQRRLTELTAQLGAEAAEVVDAGVDLAIAEQRIADRVGELRAAAPKPVDHAARVQRLTQMRNALEAELTELANQRRDRDALTAAIGELRTRITDLDESIATTTQTVNGLGELAAAPQVALPEAPVLDRRPLTAAMGACGGFALGAILAILVIVNDPRMLRPIEGLLGDSTPLLGTVPTITPDQQSPADADLTALSIHQIRATLEVRAKLRDEKAFAITSASSGAGKTSLTVGLASSLALSGTRTLLVDCELAGRALSDDPQWAGDQTLDEVMVHMGYLDQREADLFVYSDDASVGLLGVLHGRAVSECIVNSTIEGLAVLPALAANAKDIGRLSSKSIRRIIDEAAGDYDMVLFDTGPIPGSIEAMLVASEVDGVVVVTSRGESQARFNKTLAYLSHANAKLAGTVFNRADREDLTIDTGPSQPSKKSKRKEAQRMPFGAHPTRRLPPPPGMGSGILAAAVQAQAQTTTQPKPEPRPDASTSADASTEPRKRERTIPAKPTPQPKPVEKPDRADSPAEISLADAGDIAAILDDAAVIAEASSDKDMTEEALEALLAKKTDTANRANHATPRDADGKPVPNSATPPTIVNPDDGLGDALDELIGDVSGAANAKKEPEIHVNPSEPSRSGGGGKTNR